MKPAAQVTRLTDRIAELDNRLAGAVAAMRDDGATWAQVGAALGVTRQAAWQRYGGPAPCPRCAGTNGNHGLVHVRHGNGAGHNEPCPNTEQP